MNKKELVDKFAEKTELTRAQATKYINSIFSIISDGLSSEKEVTIPDFGKFSEKEVPERKGINPATQEAIIIPAHSKIVFKPYSNILLYSQKY